MTRSVPKYNPLPRIPRVWSGRRWGIVAETDLRPSRGSTLRAKLLIFRSCRELRRFWSIALKKGDLGAYCQGAVNGLICWKEKQSENGEWQRRVVRADPRYFCVIGLVKTRLTMLHISHEAVHAGFCYAKRVQRRPWGLSNNLDEERVAYPAGEIARGINAFLHKRKLYS